MLVLIAEHLASENDSMVQKMKSLKLTGYCLGEDIVAFFYPGERLIECDLAGLGFGPWNNKR